MPDRPTIPLRTSRLLTLPPATTTVGAARALLTRGVELLSLVLLALLLFHRRLLYVMHAMMRYTGPKSDRHAHT